MRDLIKRMDNFPLCVFFLEKKRTTTGLKNEIYPKPREREHSRYFLFRFLSRARGGDDRNDRGFDGKHYLLVGWF